MSVQGADVATYQRLRQSLRARADAGRQPWREEPLNLSFRSAPPILQLVDAVFDAADARDGVTAGRLARAWLLLGRAPGLVEVWPLVKVEPPPAAAGLAAARPARAGGQGGAQPRPAIAERI